MVIALVVTVLVVALAQLAGAPVRQASRRSWAEALAARGALRESRAGFRAWAALVRSARAPSRYREKRAIRREVARRARRAIVRRFGCDLLLLLGFAALVVGLGTASRLPVWDESGPVGDITPVLGVFTLLAVALLATDVRLNGRAEHVRAGGSALAGGAVRLVAVVAVLPLALRVGWVFAAAILAVSPTVTRVVERRRLRRALSRATVAQRTAEVIQEHQLVYLGDDCLPDVPVETVGPGEEVGRGANAVIMLARVASGPLNGHTELLYKRFATAVPAKVFASHRALLARPLATVGPELLDAGLSWPAATVTNGTEVLGVLINRVPPAFRTADGRARRGYVCLADDGYRESDRLLIARDVTAALTMLHDLGLVHSDLSWANIACADRGDRRAILIDCDGVLDVADRTSPQKTTLGWTVDGDHDPLTVERVRLARLIWRLALGDIGDDRPDGRRVAGWFTPRMRRAAARAEHTPPRARPARWWADQLSRV
ncbi:hypothetical protein Ait01nite_056670 [Actinoplanes italicus]|uniref:hypothetical protein n=1 Tax=Actinoplanes italicus TaxID=113567 RepID=UPI000D060AE2|nr:hypothetical protein [Actinoplanes italicus]GIE32622.1 hypothetical protein Ait01nite_056670 [Actinoplanes italicus]